MNYNEVLKSFMRALKTVSASSNPCSNENILVETKLVIKVRGSKI